MAARNLSPTFSRRTALGLGAAGAAGVALTLAGCSALGENSTATATGPLKPGAKIAPISDIPLKAGRNYTIDGVDIVVTQPTEGEFRCFSSICTHEGCKVGCRQDEIVCDCHKAIYNIATGEVEDGPAPTGLPEYPIVVTDGVIFSA